MMIHLVSDMKVCSKCKQLKIFTNFCKSSKSKDGYQSQCKSCKAISVKSTPSYNSRKRRGDLDEDSLARIRERTLRYYHENKVARNISRRIRQSLNGSKSVSWERLVDYTLFDLKAHLERLFVSGMPWENYGEWHIDHIIPIAYFDIVSVDCDGFKKCWQLNNLQPLWAKDNQIKGDKYNEPLIIDKSI